MLSIFLDESGDFEDSAYNVKFIGGLIYTGDDLEEESKRLEDYLKTRCSKLNINYPQGIHTTEQNNAPESVKIKEIIKDSLVSYIRSNGKYNFVYLIKGKNTKSYINNTSNIVEERNASNLYDNMIANLIQNFLFYNPYLKDEKYKLNIATRIAAVPKENKSKIEEYESLGYEGRLSKANNKYIFHLNSNTGIKSAISSKIIENRMDKDIQTIDLQVETINYKKYSHQKRKPTTPFLYAADIACDIIKTTIANVSDSKNKYRNTGNKLKNIRQSDFYITETISELEKISGNNAFAWAYDDIEGLWGDLNLAIYRKDLLSALEYLYEIKTSNSPFAEFYYNFWCKDLIEDMKTIFNEDELELYLSKIEAYSLNKDKAKYEKGLFIAKYINKFLSSLNIRHKDKYIFKLNDILLRGYNHRGDTINGYKCIEICRQRKDQIDTLEYIEFMTRELQVYVNEFNYDKCIEKAEEIQLYLSIYKDMEEKIANELDKKPVGNIRIGKILSSLGQFYSFKNEKALALENFEQALIEFEGSDIDIETTKSYIMHLAIAQKDYELFIKYANELWKDKELELIFEDIVESKSRFKLFVYLKAINAFYLTDLGSQLWNKILTTDYNKAGFEIVHPWELIYKYMAIISLKKGFEREGQNRIEKIDEVFEKAETIKLINMYSRIEYFTLESQLDEKKNKDNDKKIQIQKKDMINLLDKYPKIREVFEPAISDNEINLETIKDIFSYMYS